MKAIPLVVAAGVLVTAVTVPDRPRVESTPQQVRVPTVPAVEQAIRHQPIAIHEASIGMPALAASAQQVRSLDVPARSQRLRAPQPATLRSA